MYLCLLIFNASSLLEHFKEYSYDKVLAAYYILFSFIIVRTTKYFTYRRKIVLTFLHIRYLYK